MFGNMSESFLKLSYSLNMSKMTKTFCETQNHLLVPSATRKRVSLSSGHVQRVW